MPGFWTSTTERVRGWKLPQFWRIKVSWGAFPPRRDNRKRRFEPDDMSSLSTAHAPKGLEGVVATTSSICFIDGDQGVLAYRGIDTRELADNSTFEETCYLLWFGKLPTRDELKALRDRLAMERKLNPAIINLLRT
jgi:hypothetical protein